jgi:hypothetical protein
MPGPVGLNCLNFFKYSGATAYLPNAIGDQHLVNVVAFGALERAEVETCARRRDAGEHHVSVAFRAFGAMDLNVEMSK